MDVDEGRDGYADVSENLEGRSVVQASQVRNWMGLTSVQMSQVQVSGEWSGAGVRSMGGVWGLDSDFMAGGFVAVRIVGALGLSLKIFSMFAWSANNECLEPGGEVVVRLPTGLLSLGGT